MGSWLPSAGAPGLGEANTYLLIKSPRSRLKDTCAPGFKGSQPVEGRARCQRSGEHQDSSPEEAMVMARSQ